MYSIVVYQKFYSILYSKNRISSIILSYSTFNIRRIMPKNREYSCTSCIRYNFKTDYNNKSKNGNKGYEEACKKTKHTLHINDLPDEILCIIFSYLHFRQRICIERVCTRWRHIGKEIPWTDIRFFHEFDYIPWSYIDKRKHHVINALLSRCGIGLKIINISASYSQCKARKLEVSRVLLQTISKNCVNLTTATFRQFAFRCRDYHLVKQFMTRCNQLETMKLDGCNIEDNLLKIIFTRGKVKTLILKSLPIFVSGDCFRYINEHLRVLVISSNNIKLTGLSHIATHKSIERLYLHTFHDLENVRDQESLNIFRKLAFCLHGLRLCQFSLPPFPYNNKPLLQSLQHCVHLRDLRIYNDCFDFDISFFHDIVTNFKELSYVLVYDCINFNDECLRQLGTLKHLQYIEIDRCYQISYYGLKCLALKTLQYLCIFECDYITSETIESIQS